MKLNDLIEYNHVVRGLYLDAMNKITWGQVVEPRGLSFDSMRNVFLHLTHVEDRWINYIIPGRFKEWLDLDFETFKDIESLQKYALQVKSKTEIYIKTLSINELSRQIAGPWADKPSTIISVKTALTHMVMEDMIHYGELSAALWQMGIEAPYLGFWKHQYQTGKP